MALNPNDVAIIDSATETSWTYANINERVEKLATYLLKKGLKKGDQIVLLAPNHISYFSFNKNRSYFCSSQITG